MSRAILTVAAVAVMHVLTGCAPYVEAQQALVNQSQHGLERVRQAYADRTAMLQRHHAQQRERLDAAFDADVRGRETLEAEWVIEARRAYAVGIDALHAQQRATDAATDATNDNLAAVEQALNQLELLVKLPMAAMNNAGGE